VHALDLAHLRGQARGRGEGGAGDGEGGGERQGAEGLDVWHGAQSWHGGNTDGHRSTRRACKFRR